MLYHEAGEMKWPLHTERSITHFDTMLFRNAGH